MNNASLWAMPTLPDRALLSMTRLLMVVKSRSIFIQVDKSIENTCKIQYNRVIYMYSGLTAIECNCT
jgi:hypothetical protein